VAIILPFPQPFVCVEAEIGGQGWMVVTPGREQGLLHGDFSAAMANANEIASELGVSLRSSAWRNGR
jgi:hypothetical protein